MSSLRIDSFQPAEKIRQFVTRTLAVRPQKNVEADGAATPRQTPDRFRIALRRNESIETIRHG
jgi:hypothetical protein